MGNRVRLASCFLLVMSLLGAVGPGAAAPVDLPVTVPATHENSDRSHWSNSGLEMKAHLVEGDKCESGHQPMLDVTFRNTGDRKGYLGMVTEFSSRFEFEVMHLAGPGGAAGRIPRTLYGRIQGQELDGSSWPIWIEPGGTYSHRFPIGRSFDMSLPGTYTLAVLYRAPTSSGIGKAATPPKILRVNDLRVIQ